jgi:hypothetical protein
MDWLTRLKAATRITPAAVQTAVERHQDEETVHLFPFRGAAEIVTPEGERVWIATEPEAVKLIPDGAVYFLGEEIMQLKKAGKEAARVALMVKEVFGSEAVIEKC